MLSLRRCRDVLGSVCSLSDSEIEAVQDQLRILARVALEEPRGCRTDAVRGPRDGETRPSGPKAIPSGKHDYFSALLQLVPEDERYSIEERASILEFEAGLHRTDAERSALLEWISNKR
jgi:hypothetical protein